MKNGILNSLNWLSRWLLALCLIFAFATSSICVADSNAQPKRTDGVIAPDKPWRMPWYSIDSGEKGPTVLVVGGVHGNEPAGFRAAQQIRHWPIVRGKLIVIPSVNRLGLLANMRWLPAHRNNREFRDPNRNFPTADKVEPRTEHCAALWEFATQQKPDWVFDLHEGFDFHHSNSKSVGSSVITFPRQDTTAIARLMRDAVNRTIADEELQFDLLAKSGPAKGSFARACYEQLGARSFILETTFKDQPLSKRTRQHRLMMSVALMDLGMIVESQQDRVFPGQRVTGKRILRVGLYDGTGTGGKKAVDRVIDRDQDLELAHIGPQEMRKEVLEQFDVILFPGGSGSKQGKAIGESGRRAVKEFVSEGGGYVGICAGAYLCSAHYDWSLHIINTKVFNKTVEVEGVGRKSMWYRGGSADVKVEFTKLGSDLIKMNGTHVIRYQNGPIVSPGKDTHLGEYQVLANFRSENAKYPPQVGTMVDTPAITTAKFGRGRVVSISPHFESTTGEAETVADLIRFAAQ